MITVMDEMCRCVRLRQTLILKNPMLTALVDDHRNDYYSMTIFAAEI